jgi:transcription antitermination protein NusB
MSKGEKRAAARLAAVQALYQMDLAGTGRHEILAQFEAHWIGQEVEGDQYQPADLKLFRDIVDGVLANQRQLDLLVDDALRQGWPLTRIETVLRAILRAGGYELQHRRDIPARVVIAEYADIGGAFFGREEVGMVNGVLDALAKKLRAREFETQARPG